MPKANTLLQEALDDLGINAPYWVVKETKTTITIHFLGRANSVTWRRKGRRKGPAVKRSARIACPPRSSGKPG